MTPTTPKIYRFSYSCYCLKVEKALDLLEVKYERVQVPYLNRSELADLTQGYIQVPVLVEESGRVLKDSRAICEFLTSGPSGERLVPKGLEGVVWAYHDWSDNQLEDVMFRIASPLVSRTFKSLEEKAFYTFIKERKYGKNCIQTWETKSQELLANARDLLAPTEKTLSQREFLLGAHPTLADAALYGQFAMLDEAGLNIERNFGTVFAHWFDAIKR